jgi:hypothetical protein
MLATAFGALVLLMGGPSTAGCQAASGTTTDAPATPIALHVGGDAIGDTAFLRSQVGFATLVGDSGSADVLLRVRATKAGEENRYEMEFRGMKLRPGRVDTLSRVLPAESTDSARVRTLAAAIRLGLLPYVERSGIRDDVGVQFAESTSGSREKDRWNRWVMSIGLNGSLYSEHLSSMDNLSYSAGAGRSTESSRLDIMGSVTTDGARYDIGGQSITNRNTSTYVSGVAVRRLGTHWSLGAMASATTSNVLNQKLAIVVAPAIEWSAFPYEQFTTRQLVAQYSAGIDRFRYVEVTIYDRLAETQPRHSLAFSYTTTRTWGSEMITLLGSQYLRDPSRRRFTASNSTSLQVAGGLSISAGASYSLIRDQLYLAKGAASVEDVLLRRRQLETSYQYSLMLGFSYLFGSKGPAIPNPRLSYGSGAAASVMY